MPDQTQEMKSESSNGEGSSWRPILDGSLGERAFEAVQAIADSLRGASLDKVQDASLAGGHAGLAFLYAYLDLTQPEEGNDETAVQFLQQAIDALSAQGMSPSLYSGFTGVAWAVEHLKGGPLDSDEEETNEDIDEVLKEYLNQSPWTDDYDLIIGLVGFGVYALERLPRPMAVECLERVIDRLDETGERSDEGISWHTHPDLLPLWQREICPNGYYNLGLAHGVPGVIAFLSQVWAAGIAGRERTLCRSGRERTPCRSSEREDSMSERSATVETTSGIEPSSSQERHGVRSLPLMNTPSLDKARSLLDGAVRWLLAQRLSQDAGSRFASWLAPGLKLERSRLAWCYGDVGIAAALLVAARCAGEPAWEREALDIARHTTARPPEQSGVVDAGLCHGAAGLGHIYNRMFQATGEARFKQAARFWFERTLDMRRIGQGIAGYSVFMPEESDEERWVADPGILTGAAGIALALLSAVAPIEPEWDKMLLVSIPLRR